MHAFLLLKLSYYLETTFFIITGRFNLMTSYIITHHSTYPMLIWYALATAPGGHGVFFVSVNLFTHFVYFSQRLIFLPFPQLRKSWSQKVFVWLHITQFSVILIHGSQLVVNNYCNYPIGVTYVALVWGCLMIGMYATHWIQRIIPNTDKNQQNQHHSSKLIMMENWMKFGNEKFVWILHTTTYT